MAEITLDDPRLREIAAGELRARLVGVPDAVAQPLVTAQLTAKFGDLAARHPHSEVRMLFAGGNPVAYLVTDDEGPRTRLCDIAVALEARGRGHGRALLDEMLAKADAENATVDLTVWHDAPAREWYERHGFAVVGGDLDAYLEMRREFSSIHSVA